MIYTRLLTVAIFGLSSKIITHAQEVENSMINTNVASMSGELLVDHTHHKNLRGDSLKNDESANKPDEKSSSTPRQLQQCRNVTGSSSLSVYAGPCSSFPNLGSIYQNAKVNYTGWKNVGPSCSDGIAWASVKWPTDGAGVAYIASNYLAYCTDASSSCRKVTGDNVIVRTGPCTTFPPLGTVNKGYQVTYKNWKVTNQAACSSGIYWAQIRYPYGSTGIGYVDSSKLSYCPSCSYSSSTYPNAQPIADFLRGQGITDPKAIAVVLGNLQQESSLNPLACEAYGGPASSLKSCPVKQSSSGYWMTGVGILQWSDPQNKPLRRTQFFDYCTKNGLNVDSLSSQLQFMAQESQWTSAAKACFATVGKAIGTASDNSVATSGTYWSCAALWTGWGKVGSRVTYANQWLQLCPA